MTDTLEDIGERGAIKRIVAAALEQGIRVDSGDDCSMLELDDRTLLFTTDVIHARTHIPPGAAPEQIGWFAAAINLSDIAAMGGTPLGMLFSFSLPKGYTTTSLERLSSGMARCLSQYDTALLGGDTKEGDFLTISGTAIGLAGEGGALLREGAVSGDVIAVTGDLGRAFSGIRIIEEGDAERGIEMLLHVNPRIEAGIELAALAGVHSCIDISDGLAESVFQLSDASSVAFAIDLGAVPAAPSLEEVVLNGADREEALLYSGGDYELLVTMEESTFQTARDRLRGIGIELTEIGRVSDGNENRLINGDTITPLERKGYEHFKGGI